MSAQTIVTLTDDDGDEFPIALPGIFRENKGADILAAQQIANEAIEAGQVRPRGVLKCDRIEYVGEPA